MQRRLPGPLLSRETRHAASPRRHGALFYDGHPAVSDSKREVIAGLNRSQKQISPKYFYDGRGSELFERIGELDEYYLTRTETSILAAHAAQMVTSFGSQCTVIEYGSGNSKKVRYLLDALVGHHTYVAIDISKEHLLRSTSALARDYSNLTVVAVCADYLRPLPLPVTSPCVGTRVGFFPGSTLGNFSPREAIQFLRTARQHLGPGGKLLLGVDLKKDPRLLHAAYNDTEGVTAAFNLNVLARINCECGADFDVDGFRHRAFYNEPLGRVEMHLRSTRAQTVHIDGTPIEFTEGETIHTENCYKYTYAECERLAVCCGFELTRYWTDKNDWFGVFMLRRES